MKLSRFLILFAIGFLAASGLRAAGAPSSTPAPAEKSPAAVAPKSTPKPDVKRTLLYSLDFDENADLFLDPKSKKPFSGPVYSVYDNGVTELVGFLTEGQRTGWWVEYAENGQKTSEGLRKNDMEDGFWTYWWDNGNLASQGAYKVGSSIGKWDSFFENGKPDSSGEYKDGLMDGPWIFHDEQTGEARTIQYDMGVQLKK